MKDDLGGDSFRGANPGIRSERTSRVLAVRGDRVRFAGRLKAGSAPGGGVAIELLGSSDGCVWATAATLAATDREWISEECPVVQFAYVRLHTRLIGPGGPVGFDTRVEFVRE